MNENSIHSSKKERGISMISSFGSLPDGRQASLYTICGGRLRAAVTDLGATLVSLWVPDRAGNEADVVLGYDNARGYFCNEGFLGAVVGRSANRIRGAQFQLGGKTVRLTPNEGKNNLHSGPDTYHTRLWDVVRREESSVRFRLYSPDGDQGFPGNAEIFVTYALENDALVITYEALCDQDTVFNFTNHAYFNLAGENHPEKAMAQTLQMNARWFCPDDAENIPTGEERPVAGTPFDFRVAKPLGEEIGADYEPLKLQGGYDHNFEVLGEICAVLSDPDSGRTMAVSTDCPGLQVYTANFLDVTGKNGVHYGRRGAVCLETQFAPDSVHRPQWPQPFVRAGEPYRSVTRFAFGTQP